MEMSDYLGQLAFLPAAAGFLSALYFFSCIGPPHSTSASWGGRRSKASLKKSTMLILVVTIHNIPEANICGAVFAGLMNNSKVTLAGAFALSIGIAIQNVPEVYCFTACQKRKRRIKAFIWYVFGIVEPIGGGITILLASKITPLLPSSFCISKEL